MRDRGRRRGRGRGRGCGRGRRRGRGHGRGCGRGRGRGRRRGRSLDRSLDRSHLDLTRPNLAHLSGGYRRNRVAANIGGGDVTNNPDTHAMLWLLIAFCLGTLWEPVVDLAAPAFTVDNMVAE